MGFCAVLLEEFKKKKKQTQTHSLKSCLFVTDSVHLHDFSAFSYFYFQVVEVGLRSVHWWYIHPSVYTAHWAVCWIHIDCAFEDLCWLPHLTLWFNLLNHMYFHRCILPILSFLCSWENVINLPSGYNYPIISFFTKETKQTNHTCSSGPSPHYKLTYLPF